MNCNKHNFKRYRLATMLGIFALSWLMASLSYAQSEDPTPPAAEETNLANQEARIADRYDRLELLAGRLAELSRSTQPRRARLLRELITKSGEQNISGRFEGIVEALQQDRLAAAAEGQGALQSDLQKLLELLLQEGRDREIESERKRIGKYLAELKKLIRLQRGIKARTDGGDDAETLTKDQQQAAQATQKLGGQIKETDGSKEPEESQAAEGESSGEPGKPPEEGAKEQSPGEQQSESSEGSPQESESQPGEGSKGKPQQGQPSQPPGQSQPDAGESPENEQQSPADRATQKLKQAQQRMQQAKKKLEEAKRKDAVEEQEKALRELEQAKAELERILRQLREEEMERTLVLLEARFRRMLDAQIEVYEKTKGLDSSQQNTQIHELEIASGRLSRKQRQIIRDADRAMVLLREDGTSVAFPEALELAIEDMQSVAKRLADVKLGIITQGLEEDVIATLEEILASLQQAIKELRDQQSQQQQQGKGQPPGEQSLVDQLSELRMIRALQMRVNRRTARYDEMLEGKPAVEAELLEALDNLAIRQERIFRATRDLDTNRNN